MMPKTPVSTVSSLQEANALDARAGAGSPGAQRRRAALIAVADRAGLPASSATSAALMLRNHPHAEVALRVAIMELRAAIAEDYWPIEVEVPETNGRQHLVLVTGGEEAGMLLRALEERLHSSPLIVWPTAIGWTQLLDHAVACAVDTTRTQRKTVAKTRRMTRFLPDTWRGFA